MKVYQIFLILIIVAVSLVFAINLKIFLLLLIPIVVIIIPFSLVYRKLLFFITIGVFFLLPQLSHYHVFPVITTKIALFILVLIFIYALTKIRLDNSYNFLFLFFLFYIGIEALRGNYFQYKSFYLIEETIKYSFYPIGFYFTYSLFNDNNSDEKFLKQLLIFFLIAGLIISLQMFYYYFTVTIGKRVLTRQANLLLISLDIALIYIFYLSKTVMGKILMCILALIYSLGIILYMQRSLWIGTIVSLISLIIFMQTKIIVNKRKNIFVLILVALIFFVAINSYKYFALNTNILEERTKNIEKGKQDFSIATRLLSYMQVLRKIKENPIIGKGIGDSIITPYLNQRVRGIVDNSYLVVVWKLGLLGFLIFLLIYIKFFSQLCKIINKSQNSFNRIFAIMIISVFLGHLVNGLACVIMTLYYFNYIWVSFIAVTDYLYRKEFIVNE